LTRPITITLLAFSLVRNAPNYVVIGLVKGESQKEKVERLKCS